MFLPEGYQYFFNISAWSHVSTVVLKDGIKAILDLHVPLGSSCQDCAEPAQRKNCSAAQQFA